MDLFAFASNMSATSLRSKGVEVVSICPAILEGWRLVFNIPDPFPFQGSLANVVQSPGAETHGALITCGDESLAALDRMEALGILYERKTLTICPYEGAETDASVYIGLSKKTAEEWKPSLRYKKLIVGGAHEVGLDKTYLEKLEALEPCAHPDYPEFSSPDTTARISLGELEKNQNLTALFGHVFDIAEASDAHDFLRPFLGGNDVTLLFLSRMDDFDGAISAADIENGRLTDGQRSYLNDYLHEFAQQYRYVGELYK